MDSLLVDIGYWLPVKDGDPRAFDLMTRHYTFHPYKDGRRRNLANRNRHLIVGPGNKLVLITVDCDALFIWRKFRSRDHQQGINCAVFRNESNILSSQLILEAEELAWRKWPGERLYTYVNASAIKSTNPGYCFLMAGWTRLEKRTKERGLVILEKYPHSL